MAISNRDRVGKTLELLGNGLAPFVEREFRAIHGDQWQEAALDGGALRGGRRQAPAGGPPAPQPQRGPNLADPQVLLAAMWNHWNDVFARTLGQAERSLVSELRDVRNRWAHNEAFSGNDAHRALDSAGRLLSATSAAEAAEVEQMRVDLLRVQFDEQRRQEMRKASFAPTEGKPQGGLKPWREVATPHVDVSSGRYQQAEFAADLWQVYQNEGSDEYKHPIEFFRRTFLTAGLAQLLIRALLRLSGSGGDPVVELQTNFGGGKTHALLALWHLFSGAPLSELPGVDELAKEAGVDVAKIEGLVVQASRLPAAAGTAAPQTAAGTPQTAAGTAAPQLQASPHPDGSGLVVQASRLRVPHVRRAVIVGTKISPGQPHKKPDGTIVRTLWGEIAWQLGGKEGYKLVREADETGTNPGDVLKELFNKYSPCLILIDEWVAYARQLHDGSSLPGGTFDTQFTFAQAISESAKAAKNTLLVVSVPSSDNEIGGEWGQKALERIKNAIGRVESSWRPASSDEGFEIVRRRLFQPLTNDQAKRRDAVARAFSDLYGQQQQEFPTECREADYERRLKMAYPIHPELFDRLYNDWSALDKFQRTRGVLRLMAAVIHSLWERQDGNLLILPANVPVDDQMVQQELTRYLEDGWVPVIEKDVDGPNSLPLSLDRENPNLGRYSASRRVSRTIYMGSAPMQRAANRGIDDRRVKLGCVQPGEAVATFGDALRRLTDRATYLYIDGKRYWYSTQPTVTRLADDRAGQLSDDDVTDELEKRLRDEAKSRGEFAKVHACAAGGDIPDEREIRLVLLSPDHPHTAKDAASPARQKAAAILDSRGSSPRNYKNTLVFLAADATRLRELESAARQYLAWTSIWDDRETLNLDQFQTKQADTKRKNADETVDSRIPETYQWLIVPGQSDPKGPVEWTEIRLQGQDSLAVRAAKKLKNAELLMVELGGVRLRHELDRVPLWRGNHVGIKQLADDLPRYLYLPRLRDEDVLLAAIMDGVANLHWIEETFAYAEAWDESRGRYNGLRTGQQVRVLVDAATVLVKPDVAAAQIEAERQQAAAKVGTSPATGQTPTGTSGPGSLAEATSNSTANPTGTVIPPPPKLGRFHGSVQIDPIRLGRDASRIAEEVVQHLAGIVDANVEITLEIHAEIPEGATDKLVRDVTENCRTLRFTTYGFEQS